VSSSSRPPSGRSSRNKGQRRLTRKLVRDRLEEVEVLRRYAAGDESTAIAKDLGISKHRLLTVVVRTLIQEFDDEIRALVVPAAEELVANVAMIVDKAVGVVDTPCRSCRGSGSVSASVCPACQGDGHAYPVAERVRAAQQFLDELDREPNALLDVATLQQAMLRIREEIELGLEKARRTAEREADARRALLESERVLEDFLVEALRRDPLAPRPHRFADLQQRLHDHWVEEARKRLREQHYVVIHETKLPSSWPRSTRAEHVRPQHAVETGHPARDRDDTSQNDVTVPQPIGDWRAGQAWGEGDFAPRGDPRA
jgi:hypothetical protein